MNVEIAVVGAGTAGLSCARALAGAGRRPVVLERSRGVGGRCATRRIEGQPVDHGLAFLHGSDPGFLEAARSAEGATVLDGWPWRVAGTGPPCLPKAFGKTEHRLAFREGLTAFPKALAAGLDVRIETEATALEDVPGAVRIGLRDGRAFEATAVVLALPAPASRRLLQTLANGDRDLEAVRSLLGMVGTQACLTVLAGYPHDAPRPQWDALYPDESDLVQFVSLDSAKREAPRFTVLVVQARPCWSRLRLETPDAEWCSALVHEAARLIGPWAGAPDWVQAQRWRYARADRGSEMSRPLSLRLPGGGRVILTGESFAPGGGVEAAWLAGNAGAARLIEEE